MARLPIIAFLVAMMSASHIAVASADRMSQEAVQEMRAERHKLVTDIESASDNHKREGKGFVQVRTLLHKYYNLVNRKHGVPTEYDGETVLKAIPQFDDGTELSKNRNIAADLFESDVVLTVEQAQALVDKLDTSVRDATRKRRKLISNTAVRWAGAKFPYRFAEEDSQWQDVIRSALRQWETETCVRFEENGAGNDYVQFFKGGGCYANVGRTGGAQQISIGEGCGLIGIVAHEIGHTLGFWHEQSRPDRDDYINVNPNNMIAGTQAQVSKRDPSEVNDYGIPYDLGSVMHYGPRAFAYDQALLTLITDESKYQNTIGQRAHLSFIDVKQMNKAYCSGKCTTALGCQNHGYENPNNCNECKCPEGLGGQLCDAVQPSNCGEDLSATSEWKTLSNFDGGPCYWRIKSNGGKVRFELTTASFDCQDTCSSYVEIKYNGNVQQTGFRQCCDAAGGEVVSVDDFILVIAKGGGNFEMRYKSEGGSNPDITPTPNPNGVVTPTAGATPTAGVTPTPTPVTTTTQEWTPPATPTPTAIQTPVATPTPTPTSTPTTRHHKHHRTTTTEFIPTTAVYTPEPTRHHKHHKHHTTTTQEPETTHHQRRHHHRHTTTSSDFEF